MSVDSDLKRYHVAFERVRASFLALLPYEGITPEVLDRELREMLQKESFFEIDWKCISNLQAIYLLEKYSFLDFYMNLATLGRLHPTLERYFINEEKVDFLYYLERISGVYLYEMIYYMMRLQHAMI